MKFFQETTVWGDNVPNHVYLLSDDKSKLYAYVKHGTDTVFTFKKPIKGFSTKGRTFREVANTYNYKLEKEEVNTEVLADVALKRWTVQGSKGNTYTVTLKGKTLVCSCPGHTYRGKCKHTEEVHIG